MTSPALISIVDCNLCVGLLTREQVEALPLPDTWTRLSTVATRDSDPGDCEEVRACPSCGTYYHYHQFHDHHSGEPRPATTDWSLSRMTPHFARALLHNARPRGESSPLQDGSFEKRYTNIIELLCRDLARAPNLHVKMYMVNTLYEHFVSKEQDWNGLKTTLIDHPDPAIRVHAACFFLGDKRHDTRRAAKRLLAAERTREKLLIAVLADGLSQKGELLWGFTLGYAPAVVAGIAMHTLRYKVPRKSLAPAVAGLVAELRRSSCESWWREAARELLVEYVGEDRERANEVFEAAVGDTEEALAVRQRCQTLLQ